jgi:hypothetical protein
MLSLDPRSAESAVQQACAELSRRLRAGQECSAEDVANSFPSVASNPETLMELVLTELSIRRQLGQELKPDEWYNRYPHWRERLWLWFAIESEVTEDRSPNTMATVDQSPQPVLTEKVPEKAFGRYQLLSELGRGGMGIVYQARDPVLGRLVALKMIRAGVLACPEEVERFYREARAASQLKHPHIIGVYDIDCQENEHFLTMEFVVGGSLTRSLSRFQDDPRKAVVLMEKVARGVHHAHSKGILHRDLKPGNILLDENDEPRISDFGLAKFLEADAALTQSGVTVGTPAYMAPEQAGGQKDRLTPRSDVWSLGVILFELLTGKRPFAGNGREAIEQVLTAEPPRPRCLRPGLDRSLEIIVLKCLEKDPARRYASAEALADDLARWQRGEAIQARPASWARRAWRVMRRHSRVSMALLALVLAAAAAPVILNVNEPERPLREMQGQLQKGQAVTLIGQSGPPRWFRWLVRENIGTASTDPKLPFFISTDYDNFLELLPDPGLPAYRFSAEVQQLSAAGPSARVGIYFGHALYPLATGPEHCCFALVFNDLQGAANDPQIPKKDFHLVQLQARRYREKGVVQTAWGVGGVFSSKDLAPAGRPVWRRLAVEVTPKQVRAFWEGNLIVQITRPKLAEHAHTLFAPPRQTRAAVAGLPASPFGKGLGLTVMNGSASVRSVVIQPISGP